MALEKLSFESVNGRTDRRTDGRTDDGRKVITIAHHEHSSGELKHCDCDGTKQRIQCDLKPEHTHARTHARTHAHTHTHTHTQLEHIAQTADTHSVGGVVFKPWNYLVAIKNRSTGSTERRASGSQFSFQTGSGKIAFAADRQVLLVQVIFAEFLRIFSAKRLFLLRELNHREDVETLLQRNSFPFYLWGYTTFVFTSL